MSLLDTSRADKVIEEYFAWRSEQDLPTYGYVTKAEQRRAKEEQDRAYDTYRDNLR